MPGLSFLGTNDISKASCLSMSSYITALIIHSFIFDCFLIRTRKMHITSGWYKCKSLFEKISQIFLYLSCGFRYKAYLKPTAYVIVTSSLPSHLQHLTYLTVSFVRHTCASVLTVYLPGPGRCHSCYTATTWASPWLTGSTAYPLMIDW